MAVRWAIYRDDGDFMEGSFATWGEAARKLFAFYDESEYEVVREGQEGYFQ